MICTTHIYIYLSELYSSLIIIKIIYIYHIKVNYHGILYQYNTKVVIKSTFVKVVLTFQILLMAYISYFRYPAALHLAVHSNWTRTQVTSVNDGLP